MVSAPFDSFSIPTPAQRELRRALILLCVVVVALTALAGIPGPGTEPANEVSADHATAHASNELFQDLVALRAAIGLYSDQHAGDLPGASGFANLVMQLSGCTDASGAACDHEDALGPYVDGALLSGTGRTVDAVPERADGTTDWIWCPSHGTLRSNRTGVDERGVSWYSL